MSEHALTASQLYIEHIVHAYVQASIAQLQHTSQEVHSLSGGADAIHCVKSRGITSAASH